MTTKLRIPNRCNLMKKHLIFLFAITILLFGSVYVPSSRITDHSVFATSITSGEINGISYSHGSINFSESGNFTSVANDTVTESENFTRISTQQIGLITDAQIADFYFHSFGEENNSGSVGIYNDWYNNVTYNLFVDFILNQMPLRFDPLNKTHGEELMDLQVIENYSEVVVAAVSTDGAFLGQFPTNTTHIEYNHKYLNGTITHKSGEIVAEYIIFRVVRTFETVKVNHTRLSYAQVGYYARNSIAYNVNATAYTVNITDGENFGLQVNMFDSVTASYSQFFLQAIGYYFYNIELYDLTFLNGTHVDEGMYPRWMFPTVYQAQGIIVDAGYQNVTSTILSTYQGMAAGFIQRLNETTANSTTIGANFAAWGIEAGTNLIAFDDGNENGVLDLAYKDNGLQIDSTDIVKSIGLTEAYTTDVINAVYHNASYSSTYASPYLGVNITENKNNDSYLNFATEHYGFGDTNANVTTTFTFDEPVANNDGTVDFNFGIDYTGFPVTWVNTTNPANSAIDYEDIGYKYHIHVNPDEGDMSMKVDFIYGGITDATLHDAMDGLSLATVIKSQFFALHAVYSATASNATVNRTRASAVAALEVKSGEGEPATKIDVNDTRASYTTNGTASKANFTAINLFQVAAGYSAEKVSPFDSESGKTGGTAMSGSLTERFDVNFFYSADLIVVTFPEWNGNDINWDPNYGVNYQPRPKDTTTVSSTTVSSTTSTPTASTSTSTASTSTSTTSTSTSTTTSDSTSTNPKPVPGFLFVQVFVVVGTFVIIKKYKK